MKHLSGYYEEYPIHSSDRHKPLSFCPGTIYFESVQMKVMPEVYFYWDENRDKVGVSVSHMQKEWSGIIKSKSFIKKFFQLKILGSSSSILNRFGFVILKPYINFIRGNIIQDDPKSEVLLSLAYRQLDGKTFELCVTMKETSAWDLFEHGKTDETTNKISIDK